MPLNRSLTLILVLCTGIGFSHGTLSAHPHPDQDHDMRFSSRPDGGWLGVSLQELDKDLRESLDIDRRVSGALVIDVMDDSPAKEAGIKRHDVLVEFDGKRLDDVDHAIETIRDKEPGDKVRVVVYRDGQEHHLQAELGEWEDAKVFSFAPRPPRAPRVPRAPHAPNNKVFGWSNKHDGKVIVLDDDGNTEFLEIDDLEEGTHEINGHTVIVERDGDDNDKRVEVIVKGKDGDTERRVIVDRRVDGGDGLDDRVMFFDDDPQSNVWFSGSGGFLGVSTTSLGDQLREYFNVESGGVLVESVVKDSPAAKAGLKAGDVIRAVGDTKVSSPGDLRKAVRAKEPGDEVTLYITRDKKATSITVKLADAQEFGQLPELRLPEGLMALHEAVSLEELHEELEELHRSIDLEELHDGLEELGKALHEMHFEDLHLDLRELENLEALEGLRLEELQHHLHQNLKNLNMSEELERAREAYERAMRRHKRTDI